MALYNGKVINPRTSAESWLMDRARDCERARNGRGTSSAVMNHAIGPSAALLGLIVYNIMSFCGDRKMICVDQ